MSRTTPLPPLNLDCDTCGAKNAKLDRMHMCPLPARLKDWMAKESRR